MKKTVGILSALFLLTVPVAAEAQSCSMLSSQRWDVIRDRDALANYEWGSDMVFGTCKAAAQNEYRQTGSADSAVALLLVCAGGGCGLTTNHANCLAVNVRLLMFQVRIDDLTRVMRERGC